MIVNNRVNKGSRVNKDNQGNKEVLQMIRMDSHGFMLELVLVS